MENRTNSVNVPVNQQASIIIGYFQLLIGVIGEVGNVLAIIIFSRHSLRKYSYSFYCLVLAFTDIAYLLQTFISWSAYNLNADLTTAAAFLCPLTAFIPYYFGTLSTFLLSMIAVDRTLTIVYPRVSNIQEAVVSNCHSCDFSSDRFANKYIGTTKISYS